MDLVTSTAAPEKSRLTTANGRFRRGQSGNPRGRPAGVPNKVTLEIRELAKALFNEAYWKRTKERLDQGKVSPVLEQTFLAYAFGQPSKAKEDGERRH